MLILKDRVSISRYRGYLSLDDSKFEISMSSYIHIDDPLLNSFLDIDLI